ncbi:hypothetical protein B0O99DRAFT_517057 [Bisporella sp. PMI_857]|nr:hypothetical protein B0O99DRAFT_517057 [Bisporella sp. PMI_857]
MADRYSILRRHRTRLRNSIKTRIGSWMFLPAEIRVMILEAITCQKYRGWASLAAVCKEWQIFIEKRNFYRLKLQVPCLDVFQRIIIRQRELVHYIQLDIELRKYSCRCCEWEESDSWTSSNNSAIRDGIWKLFSILSAWKPANALTLELNAHSPSDSEHWWHDPKHGWINGQQVRTPPESAILRLFETIKFSLLVQNELPKTLKRLSIFEDFNNDLATVLVNAQNLGILQVDATRIVDPKVGAAFAFKSLSLEQLSISYMVNAEDFFQACMRTWTWQHLQSLALTSQLLQYTGSRQDTYTLLYSAGTIALQMPRLHTLVLWNGTQGNACAFIYHTDRYFAYLTWRGTWDLELSPCVVRAWQCVAFKFRCSELRIDKQQIKGVIGSHGDAIHRLNLPCQVVAPASLWQIRREAPGNGTRA